MIASKCAGKVCLISCTIKWERIQAPLQLNVFSTGWFRRIRMWRWLLVEEREWICRWICKNKNIAGYLHIMLLKHQSFRFPLVRFTYVPFLPQKIIIVGVVVILISTITTCSPSYALLIREEMYRKAHFNHSHFFELIQGTSQTTSIYWLPLHNSVFLSTRNSRDPFRVYIWTMQVGWGNVGYWQQIQVWQLLQILHTRQNFIYLFIFVSLNWKVCSEGIKKQRVSIDFKIWCAALANLRVFWKYSLLILLRASCILLTTFQGDKLLKEYTVCSLRCLLSSEMHTEWKTLASTKHFGMCMYFLMLDVRLVLC